MKTSQKEKIELSKTLSVLISELEEECLKVIKLAGALRIENLTEDQMEDMLGELSVSITHLKVHSEQLEQALEKELEEI